MILLPLLIALQSDRLPPANPVAYDDAETAAVMRPVNALFAAITARSPAAVLAQVRADGAATVASEKPDGSRSIKRMSWAEFTAGIKPGPQRMEERMTDVAVDVDGDIAMVWGPYVFTVDGKPQHCGADHFDLLRENGSWKIQNVTWSSRITGCDAAVRR